MFEKSSSSDAGWRDARATLLHGFCPCGDTPGELGDSVVADVANSKIPLDLENGETRLDVDTSALSRG